MKFLCIFRNIICWFIAFWCLLLTSKVGGFPSPSPFSTITYSPAMLLSLRPHCLSSCQHPRHTLPQQPQRRRGRKGGIREKNRRRKSKPYLPTIVFGNTRSLNNKLDELCACCQYLYEFRDSSLLAFVETWFNETVNEANTAVDNFQVIRGDRTAAAGKTRGGGVCLYVNERWAHRNNVTVKERLCTPSMELLTVSVRPYYLPREFTGVIVNVVYIPPLAKESDVTDILTSRIHEQETRSPDAVVLVLGDFNQYRLDSALPHFHQYVTCPTRQQSTIDLCYGNIASGYKSLPLPPLGDSDHNNIYLVPKYKPVLKKKKAEVKTIPVWNEDSTEQLRDCFECTDWDIFKDSCCDINELTDTVNAYVLFCKENVTTYKTIKIFPNNKPWVTKDLRDLLKEKRVAFRNNKESEVSRVSKVIKDKISECKKAYKQKIEEEFKSNNMRSMWNSLKTVTGYTSVKQTIHVGNESNYVEELNAFYCRFDSYDFREKQGELRKDLLEKSGETTEIIISEESVLSQFNKVKVSKASGPDNIKGHLLKICSEQLAPIYTFIFNLSLHSSTLPAIWKTSEIIPVPKKPQVKTMNNLRPVALTSIVFKCFEKIMMHHLLNSVKNHLDPCQFAYKEGRNVEDAVLIFLNNVLKHLDQPKMYVRALFIDFSSAFNTIQPHLMIEKLLDLGVNAKLSLWILEFLTNRNQYVKLNDVISKGMITNTGAPQGCVLSPILYIIYTNDCRSHYNGTPVIKFADDSSIIGLIKDNESEYTDEISKFVKWCDINFLSVNVAKTKELIFDFRRDKTTIPKLFIKGEEVEVTDSYKYLGLNIDDRLSWNYHVDSMIKKANQRLYFLRKLKQFHVDKAIMSIFYSSTLESLFSFGIVCYGGNLTKQQIARINRVIKKASKIINCEVPHFNTLREITTIKKAKEITKDKSHLLNAEYDVSTRSGRLLSKRSRTDRYKNSFIPMSTRLLQSSLR